MQYTAARPGPEKLESKSDDSLQKNLRQWALWVHLDHAPRPFFHPSQEQSVARLQLSLQHIHLYIFFYR